MMALSPGRLVRNYEAELRNARFWARIIGFCYALCRFLAFCNLTWATVALLGAFLPSLLPLDFALVTSLIVVEAGRLAFFSFFTRLLKHTNWQYYHSRHTRACSDLLQFILLAPSFVLSIIGHVFLDYASTIRNLQVSLRIFYSITAFNFGVAFAYLICFELAFASLNKSPEQSVRRYFDAVLQRAMAGDLIQVEDFEFFQFAFLMLGGEFRRKLQAAEEVAKNHKQLIQYMYFHRLGRSFLRTYLGADDVFVRLAAANMVGYWADRAWGVGVGAELELPEELLTELADKVSTDQVGWAATTSFQVLASTPRGAQILAETRTSSNEDLPARLVHLVDDSSSRSLALVRTLRAFYEQLCLLNQVGPPHPFGEADQTRLEEKLRRLAAGSRHRLRVQAAYLLLLMGKRLEDGVVLAIDPTRDVYWFRSEVMMLELLRSHIDGAPALQLPPALARPHEDIPITPPSWARPDPTHILP